MKSRSEHGQTLIEYVMVLLVIVVCFSVIDRQIRVGIGKLWINMAKEIAAPCPTCVAPDQMN